MRLASLKSPGRDGTLLVVERQGRRAAAVPEIAPTLQAALEDWAVAAPRLAEAALRLEAGELAEAIELDPAACAAPLPRAYQWLDGSAYLSHIERVRKARGAEMPETLLTDPLMYQGGSDSFLGPRDPIAVEDEEWGIDFEAEIAVITDDVPMGTAADRAGAHIKLLMLVNDVSLRRLIPAELAKGFGFVQGKPASSFSPFAVTPDELGAAWHGGKIHLALVSHVNGERFGDPDAGADMQFGFPQLIAHAARTRDLSAGTIIGSGTVSNRDRSRGTSCIVERRMIETVESGKAETEFLRFGDRVRIEMLDGDGRSIFGAIDQKVTSRRP